VLGHLLEWWVNFPIFSPFFHLFSCYWPLFSIIVGQYLYAYWHQLEKSHFLKIERISGVNIYDEALRRAVVENMVLNEVWV
jgi:hypothetical protein